MVRVISGDNELSAVEFRKHYRFDIPSLMDPVRAFEKKYNRSGWPFLMLAGPDGEIVYKANTLIDKDRRKIEKSLKKMFEKTTPVETEVVEGIEYMPATIERSGEKEKAKLRERFASVACGGGKVYVIFTTNRNGGSDVYMRVLDGGKWSEDIAVAATDADEFDGQVLVDKNGGVWVSYVSDTYGKRYNIFAAKVEDFSKAIESIRVSRARDDAMRGRLACDEAGDIWLAYYQWRRMGKSSRDKEVFVQRYSGGRWNRPMQVSPTDVPEYEDHSDVAIAASADGVMVAWSWDYHKPKGYTKDAAAPTIFVRGVNGQLTAGKVSVVSGKNIDVTPTICVDGSGNVWCAWDSLGRDKGSYRKRVFVKSVRGREQDLSGAMANVCTPSFACDGKGKLAVLWSETSDGKKWVLKKSDFDAAKKVWLKGEIVQSEGNPRFCGADYDENGRLWVAYSKQTDDGSAVVVEKITNK